MFRIKVCGVTRAEDARVAADAGADAIGLNFYAKSPRFVTADSARAIRDAVADCVRVVGVFVNETPERIAELIDAVGLDAVQLHGDEPFDAVAALPAGVPVVRAFRVGAEGLGPAGDYASAVAGAGRPLAAALVDAAAAGAYGGTGKTVDWALVRRQSDCLAGTPIVLAGGLQPGNVAAAIREVRPAGVDVASGVESQPGIKDAELVRDFVASAGSTLDEIRAAAG